MYVTASFWELTSRAGHVAEENVMKPLLTTAIPALEPSAVPKRGP